MRRASLLYFTSAFCLFPFALLSAQGRAHNIDNVRAWLEAVERHIPGDVDAAARTTGSWSGDDLDMLIVDVNALVQLVVPSGGPLLPRTVRGYTANELGELQAIAKQERKRGVNRLMKRGALLHTDVALLVPATGGRPFRALRSAPLLPPRPQSVLISDAQLEGIRDASIHLDVARLLLDGVGPVPGRDEAVRAWYRAIAMLLEHHHYYSDAVPHLEHARKIFPDDAALQMDSGCVYEALAAPAIQSFVQNAVLPTGTTVRVDSARTNWQRAERFFRRSVELDGTSAEGRLRLGRVTGLLGRHEDAAAHLERAAALAGDAQTRYYADLFLGAEQQALGRFDLARARLERAADLYPQAQSPHLALSQLARRQGDRTAALRAIQKLLDLGPAQYGRDDPWWSYHDGPMGDHDERLAAARAALFVEVGQ